MDIDDIQQSIDDFVTQRDWQRYHTSKNVAIALSVEVSELLEILQWKDEQEIVRIQKDSQEFGKIRDEFADVMIYLLRFADLLDIDVEQAVLDKIRKNDEKYPVELSKGTFVKYSDR